MLKLDLFRSGLVAGFLANHFFRLIIDFIIELVRKKVS
jgi:hypothetical protein